MEYSGIPYSVRTNPLPRSPDTYEPYVVIPRIADERTHRKTRFIGLALLAVALGGLIGPLSLTARLEANQLYRKARESTMRTLHPPKALPPAIPVAFDPLVNPDGSSITPVNTDFSLIVPTIGINAPVIASVNPTNPGEYQTALKEGVAHASTSFLPDENGTVYLFSHSTNYEWFVRDLNAVFYHLKNLEEGNLIVVFYKGNRYTYKLREKRIVSPREVSYLMPQSGHRNLILQTCWPPGSVAQRLLLFADLIDEQARPI